MAEVDDLLRKIQALIDKAHGGTTDAESKALLAKADELMVKYSIDSGVLLDPNRPNSARPVYDTQPEVRDVVIFNPGDQEADWNMLWAMESMFRAVCQHLFIRVGSISLGNARVVGYPVDLRFLEMFFLKIKLHMFSEMLTTVDPNKPWTEVMAGLKNMGYRWEEVHQKLGGRSAYGQESGHPEYPYRGLWWERKFGVRFTAEMKKIVEANPGMARNKSSNPEAWRMDYVQGYVIEIQARLADMRRATIDSNPNLPDLIEGKKNLVDEKFYDEYPDRRPHPEDCECERCHMVKCEDPDCDRPACMERRKPVRTSSRARYRTLNVDARYAGRAAGARADLSDKGPIG